VMVDKQTPAQTVLQQAVQPLHAGEYQVALDYGFTWDEIRVLEALSLQDFQWLKDQSAQFIEFEARVNHAQVRLALARLDAQKNLQALQQRLLVAGAPRHLMIQMFGWIPQHYRNQRKLLKLDDHLPHGGRPTNPTLNEEEDILAAWDQRAALDLPERYLQTAVANGVDVRQVCRALSLREERERDALAVAPRLQTGPVACRQNVPRRAAALGQGAAFA
jgi:hypothetical protein